VLPDAIGNMFGWDFLEYRPIDYGQQEQPGNVSWPQKAGELPFIPCKSMVSRMQPLDAAFEDFLQHLFRAGVVDKSQPQRNFLAQTRKAGQGAPQTFTSSGTVPFYDPKASAMRPTKGTADVREAVVKANPHLRGTASDWKKMLDLKRETAYTFRGDSRDPTELKTKFNGFQPSSTRTDNSFLEGAVFDTFADYMQRAYKKTITLAEFKTALANSSMADPSSKQLFVQYSVWRMLMKSEEMHLGRMAAHEVLKGYVSSTKAVPVAKGYSLMKDSATEGWVYCLLLEGGYLVPEQGKDAWTQMFGEQEIAYPGAVPWDRVYGFRKVLKVSRKFSGNVFLRSTFASRDNSAAEQVYTLLSGKPQGGQA
jgi:hypothetical protein